MSTERALTIVLVRAEDSNGQVAVIENTVRAGAKGPHLHHHQFDEAFYLLEGELLFQLGDELVRVGKGELAFAPRGLPHAFTNRSGADARVLIVCTPAGVESYFDRIAAERAGVDPPPDALKPIPEAVRVGPRIGERTIDA